VYQRSKAINEIISLGKDDSIELSPVGPIECSTALVIGPPKGLNVKCNIGTSNFKVDIGIIHPDKPHEYILGIVVDGYYYFNAHTANDREMVMPSMLKALGWNIYRIWTIGP
jgi:hypothetical protein